jgi:hypothetical protein
MKSLMSIPTLLTVLVIATIIALIPLSPLPLSASSDSDESETNAEQRLRQKNLGSGDSTNFNCGANAFKGAPSSLSFCQIGEPEDAEPEPEDAQLVVSKTVTCVSISGIPDDDAVCNWVLAESPNSIEPSDFQIMVAGNNPVPSSFAGSETPEAVSIGPGDYTVSESRPDTSVLQQELNTQVVNFGDSFFASGDCVLNQAENTATGTIAAGQSQDCNIINQIFIFGGTVPQP